MLFVLLLTFVECKKDLLLVIDTSDSIGENNFKEKVQPFLMRFVKNYALNVNKDGTRIAIIRFSTSIRTEIMLKFNKLYNAEDIANKIGDLKWADVHGDETRTEKALGKANEQVISKSIVKYFLN